MDSSNRQHLPVQTAFSSHRECQLQGFRVISACTVSFLCSFLQCHCSLALWHVALRDLGNGLPFLRRCEQKSAGVRVSLSVWFLACSGLSWLSYWSCFSCWNPRLCVTTTMSIFAWTPLTSDAHEAVMRAACTSPLVFVAGWLLLVGWNVGLLIFRPDAQVLPGGLSPHLSRWQDTLQSVTPSHTLQGIRWVCVCVPVMRDCALFFPPEKNVSSVYLIHLIILWKPQVQIPLNRLRFFSWVPELQAKADNPTDCSACAPPQVKSPGYIRFYYCTSIFFGPPHKLLHQLQQVQNSPARIRTPSFGLTTRVHSLWLTTELLFSSYGVFLPSLLAMFLFDHVMCLWVLLKHINTMCI